MMPDIKRVPRRDAVILLAIVLAGAAFRLRLLGEGLWRDEASTYYDVAARGIVGTVSMVARIELAPPAYFLVEKVWAQLAGVGEVALKLPSFAYGIALIVATYALGRVAASSTVGLLAAAFACVSAPAIDLSAEARVYAFAALAAALTLAAYVRAATADRPVRALAWFGIVGTVLLYANYSGAILLALLAVAAAGTLTARRDWGRLALTAAAFGAMLLLYLPWVPTMLLHARIGAPFQERTTAATFLNVVNNDFGHLLPLASRHGQLGIAFGLGAVLWAGWRIRRRLRGNPPHATAINEGTAIATCAFCAVGGACVAALLSLREPRYVFLFAPAAWVWVASLAVTFAGWWQSAIRWQKILVAVVCAVAVAAFTPSERAARTRVADVSSGIRTLTAGALALAREGPTLFLVAPDYLAPTFGYYVSRPSGAPLHGFARWDDPQIFVTAGYLQLWRQPDIVAATERRVSALVPSQFGRLVLVRDAILIDRALMPYTKANALFAWLNARYTRVSSERYPGTEEDVVMEVFAPRGRSTNER